MPRILFFVVVSAVAVGVVACGSTTFSSASNDDAGADGSASDGSTDGPIGQNEKDGNTSSDGSIDGPVALYTGQNNPNDLIVVGDKVYWTNYAEDGGTSNVTIGSVDGTLASPDFASATHANRLATDGTSIYFTDFVSPSGNDSFVASVALSGGSPTKVYSNLVAPMGLSVYNGMVYVATFYGQGSSAGEIQSVATADSSTGPPITGLNNPVSVVAGPAGLAWTESGTSTASMDGKTISASLIGTPTGEEDGLAQAWGITLVGTSEYDFTTLSGGSTSGGVVAMAALTDHGVHPSGFDTSSAKPYFITNDGTTLFWTEEGTGAADGSVRYARLSDHQANVLAAGQVEPRGIGFDAQYVYWTSYSTGVIYRAPKP